MLFTKVVFLQHGEEMHCASEEKENGVNVKKAYLIINCNEEIL